MSDLYVIAGEGLVVPHGATVTRVTVGGLRRRKQLEIVRSLSWDHGRVIRTPTGIDFLVYLMPDDPPSMNLDVNERLFELRNQRAVLTEEVADRIVEPTTGPYPHTDERLLHAAQAGEVMADGFVIRLWFTSVNHGDVVLFHAVRATVEEAIRTMNHIERPCMACLKPYRNVVHWDSEFAMADVVPMILVPFRNQLDIPGLTEETG